MSPGGPEVGLGRFADLVLTDDRAMASELLYRLSPEALREVVAGATVWAWRAVDRHPELAEELTSRSEARQAELRRRGLHLVPMGLLDEADL